MNSYRFESFFRLLLSIKFIALLVQITPLDVLAEDAQVREKDETAYEDSTDNDSSDSVATDDSDEDEEEIWDPLEGFNRGMFWFNQQFDDYILEPVATGYHDVTPDPVERGIGNFFNNLLYPSNLISSLLELDFPLATEHTGRFLVNTTVGVLGFMDIAADWGLKAKREDFGLALAKNGIPTGPYLVLPILGPSNFRDGFGRVVDGFLNPIGWINYSNASDSAKLGITFGAASLLAVHERAQVIEAVKAAKESSLDYYLFLQKAYYQDREGRVTGKGPRDFTAEAAEAAEAPE